MGRRRLGQLLLLLLRLRLRLLLRDRRLGHGRERSQLPEQLRGEPRRLLVLLLRQVLGLLLLDELLAPGQLRPLRRRQRQRHSGRVLHHHVPASVLVLDEGAPGQLAGLPHGVVPVTIVDADRKSVV